MDTWRKVLKSVPTAIAGLLILSALVATGLALAENAANMVGVTLTSPDPLAPLTGPNLLTNPGFEDCLEQIP